MYSVTATNACLNLKVKNIIGSGWLKAALFLGDLHGHTPDMNSPGPPSDP